MSGGFFDGANVGVAEKLPTQRQFHFRCKLVVKDVTYQDSQLTDTTLKTEKMAFLIPQASSESDRFYDAWLPSSNEEEVEITCRCSAFRGYFRCMVRRADERMREPHLFVMSKGAEEEFKKISLKKIFFTTQKIDLTVMSEDDEELSCGTEAVNYDLPVNRNTTSTAMGEIHG
jgi:hypothetical protein